MNIQQLLKQAQEESFVLLPIDGEPAVTRMDEPEAPTTSFQARKRMDRYLAATWKTDGPGFQRLMEWVETRWDPDGEKPTPNGSVAISGSLGQWSPSQLGAAAATRKLIAAAKIHGRDRIAKCATEFAIHGMIEVHYIYVLKGSPVSGTKPLDRYCSLLPYAEGLRKMEEEFDDEFPQWPAIQASGVCALEIRQFERPDRRECAQGSPLMKHGPDVLALLLGLVGGGGYRMFGTWHGVPTVNAAALPYQLVTYGGSMIRRTTLNTAGFGPSAKRRPLAIEELRHLVRRYSGHSAVAQRRLSRAMARLRDSSERIDRDDAVIDVGIALKALFVDEDEPEEGESHVPRRVAWHYSDSKAERQATEDTISRFMDLHGDIMSGRKAVEEFTSEGHEAAKLLADADDLLRTSLKSVIAEGWPRDWENAADPSAFRHDPARTEVEIPSVKSDSLSWSVREQREIDQALEAVWRSIVEQAPLPPADMRSTAAQISRQTAEEFRERGIPYVVVHPARLYSAHPRWPETATEPPDERTMYYCARDVERHLRQWSKAARHRGLVQLRLQTGDDDITYLLKNRDRWPQPVYSSHEVESSEDSGSRETASVHGSPTTSSASEPPGAAEEESVQPPPEWSGPVTANLERAWVRQWLAFQHDVNVLTNSLLHHLDAIQAKHRQERQFLTGIVNATDGDPKTLEDAVRTHGNNSSMWEGPPRLRAYPMLIGEPLFRRTELDGSMEQSALRGWVYEVYDRWESGYRNHLRYAAQGVPGIIRPRQQVIGDLRHIRNNLIHTGIARKGEAGDCEILRWFETDERMQMRLGHVLDFLNQMGWLHEPNAIRLDEGGTASFWTLDRTERPGEARPDLISARPVVHWDQQDPQFRYEASVAFENGVFARIPMGPAEELPEWQHKQMAERWVKMLVNDDGDLHVPGWTTVSAEVLYRNCLTGERQPGPGIWTPPMQFREPRDEE